MTLYWLDSENPDAPFPPAHTALNNPNGLLAAGGDLSPERLLKAYPLGIFPWYEKDQPILWWSPNPRCVLAPENINISRSTRKSMRKKQWTVTFDRHFRDVIMFCAGSRRDSKGTWITQEMKDAYNKLHEMGHAHSVEIWNEDMDLIGGLYGVAIGRMFFGESMFSHQSDASKIALVYLAHHLHSWGYPLIDCQLPSPHILSMGAEMMLRREFLSALNTLCAIPGIPSPWQVDVSLDTHNWNPNKGSETRT